MSEPVNPVEEKKFRIRTEEDLNRENLSTRRRTGIVIRFFRMIRDNPDLFLLGIIVCSCMLAGWFMARFYLGLTINEIKTEVTELVFLCIFIVTSVATAIGKVFVKQGLISTSLSGRMDHEHDALGRSQPPKNN